MKTNKWKALLALTALLGLAVACGNSGSGGVPGYPNYPDWGGNGDGGGDGYTESNIKYSFYSEGSASSGQAATMLFEENRWNSTNTKSSSYSVGSYSYNGSRPSTCTQFAFFKPKCQAYYYASPMGYCTIDIPNYPDSMEPNRCGLFTSKMNIWAEVKSNSKFRLIIQGYKSNYGAGINQILIDEIDPNSEEVQFINSGKGVKIIIGGSAMSPAWNKVLVVEIDDFSPNTTSSAVRAYYGESNNRVLFFSNTLRKVPLL